MAAARTPVAGDAEGRASELIAAAYALIAERGLEGLRTRDIAARVGINIATLHYYFPSKQALVLAVVRYANELFRTLLPAPRPGASTIQNLIQGVQHRRRVAPELHIVMLELGTRGARDPVVAAALAHNHQEWRAGLERELRDEIARGELRRDLDPQAAAAALTSFVIGSSLQLQMNPDAFEFEATLRAFERMLRAPAAIKSRRRVLTSARKTPRPRKSR